MICQPEPNFGENILLRAILIAYLVNFIDSLALLH